MAVTYGRGSFNAFGDNKGNRFSRILRLIIEAFHSTSRYLDELLIIDTEYFEQTVDKFIQKNYS